MATAELDVIISHVAEHLEEKFQGLYRCYQGRPVQWRQDQKFPKVPLYRKYKCGGCQTGSNFASGFGAGRIETTNE